MTRSRRGATELAGVLVVDKPLGLTSHEVVAALRRSTGEGRVGHAGTLDPAASGVLVVLLGAATRLAQFLSGADKSYEARIAFGVQTETDDAEGDVVRVAPVPRELSDRSFAEQQVAQLVGEHRQRPPAYSAIKRHGVTSYRAVRAGQPIELEPRRIRVRDASLVRIVAAEGVAWDLTLVVSKGTYIRSIARDLGISFNCGAHLTALRRTSSGALALRDAHSLEEAVASGPSIAEHFTDPVRALDLTVVSPSQEVLHRVRTGCSIDRALCPGAPNEGPVALADHDHLFAVYEASGGALRPLTVFPSGVAR